jgi:hypothetical protein
MVIPGVQLGQHSVLMGVRDVEVSSNKFLFILLYYSERMYTSRLDTIQKGHPLCLTISPP